MFHIIEIDDYTAAKKKLMIDYTHGKKHNFIGENLSSFFLPKLKLNPLTKNLLH